MYYIISRSLLESFSYFPFSIIFYDIIWFCHPSYSLNIISLSLWILNDFLLWLEIWPFYRKWLGVFSLQILLWCTHRYICVYIYLYTHIKYLCIIYCIIYTLVIIYTHTSYIHIYIYTWHTWYIEYMHIIYMYIKKYVHTSFLLMSKLYYFIYWMYLVIHTFKVYNVLLLYIYTLQYNFCCSDIYHIT